MKILITGAFGLLGSTLCPYLQSRQYTIIRHAHLKNGDVNVDLTDWYAANEVLNDIFPDVIVNLAAFTNVDECERDPHKAYLLNVRIVQNLARWIGLNNNKCYLVQMSTDQIYDGEGPHKEEDIVLRNYYGYSIYAGELVALSIPSTVIRTNFFGASQSPNRVSLSDWLMQSMKNGNSITVFDDIFFSPLSLSSLFKYLTLVIEKRQPGIYNLGSKNGMSKADFAFMLAKVLNLPTDSMLRAPSNKVELKAYRPKNMCMDSSYFETAFKVILPTLSEEINLMQGVYHEFC